MRKNVLLGSCLALALGALGCQDQSSAPTAPPVGSTPENSLKAAGLPALDRGRIKLPASARMSDQYLADVVADAINPGDYVCSSATPIRSWLSGEIARADQDNLDLLLDDLVADLIPTYEALFFQTEDTPQYFGYNGEFTKVMQKTDRDVKRFWDISSDDIQLLAMHGTVLQDVERVAATYQVAFQIAPGVPVPRDLAVALATEVRAAVLADPALSGGNHPIFTFNAFAISAPGLIPDKIVMGDGILEGFASLGFGDVAPQAVFAHEFAHHIQYERNYFNDRVPGATTQAELTRYTELMADAMAAYYLTHKRGGTMNRKRVEQFLQVYFQIGDCSFSNSGHHGTPNQRLAAARFGFEVANQAQKQGHILTSEQFHALFVAQYPTIVAPDAI